MIKGLSRAKRLRVSGSKMRELMRRIDRFAGDLNVLLVLLAIGLATLDVTFLFTQKIIEHLPPVTRVVYETAPASPAPTPGQ